MPINDALFWIGLTLFGTGIYFVIEGRRSLFVICVTVVGAAGAAYPIYAYYHPGMTISIPVWIYLLMLTWIFVGYDIYLRFRFTSNLGPRSTSINGGRVPLVIQSATYGTDPSKEIDVTRLLQTRERTGLVILVSNDTFGIDPAPGVPKRLEVEYSYETTRRVKTSAVEGRRLILPEH